MIGYLARRIVFFAVATVIATSIGYLAAASLLDPRGRLMSVTPPPDPADVDARLAALGLDPGASLGSRYAEWVSGIVLHWNWGLSPDGGAVADEIWSHAIASAQLTFAATVLSLMLGLGLGTLAAARHRRPTDRLLTGGAYLLVCLPPPVVYLAVQLTGLRLNTLAGERLWYITAPAADAGPAELLRGAALPTIGLVLVTYCGYHLLHRSVLLDHIDSEHVLAARARGCTRRSAILRHAVRPASIPLAQATAFALPAVFTGAFVIEAAFGRNGLGSYTIAAITQGQDVNGAAASIAFGCAMFAAGAVLADWAVVALDPRVARA